MRTRIIILVGALLVAAGVVARADRYEQPPPRTAFSQFPMEIGNWRGVQGPPFNDTVLQILGVNDYLTRAYVAPGDAGVGVYIGYWESQRQGDSIHSPQNCLPGSGWEPVSRGMLRLPDPRNPGAPPLQLNRYIVQKGLDRMLVLYWYQSHGRIIASEYWGKFYLIADAVRLNRTDAAIVRLTVPIPDGAEGEQAAEREAAGFATALLPQLEGFLPL